MDNNIADLLSIRLEHLKNITKADTFLSQKYLFLFGLGFSKENVNQINCKAFEIKQESDYLNLCTELEVLQRGSFLTKSKQFCVKNSFPFYIKICFTLKSSNSQISHY